MQGKYKGSLLTKQVDFILAGASGLIIFTDLDATLLDHDTYRYDAAQGALNLVHQHHIPLILTSSKTFAEMVQWHRLLSLQDPFIFENGGGLAFPKELPKPDGSDPEVGHFNIQFLGPPYSEILSILSPLRNQFHFRGFHDLTPEAIARYTQLPLELAQKAKQRLCSEPIIWEDTPQKLDQFRAILNKKGLQLIQGGRFYHVLGRQANKGNAVQKIIEYYEIQEGFRRVSIGLGDSPNDLPLLQAVDIPIAVQRPDGYYVTPLPSQAILAPGKGPEGWNAAVTQLIRRWQALKQLNKKE